MRRERELGSQEVHIRSCACDKISVSSLKIAKTGIPNAIEDRSVFKDFQSVFEARIGNSWFRRDLLHWKKKVIEGANID